MYHIFQALCGGTSKIRTVDGKTIPIPLENVTPNSVRRVKGAGLVDTKTLRRGDLLVSFDIIFPIPLTTKTKKKLSKLLPR